MVFFSKPMNVKRSRIPDAIVLEGEAAEICQEMADFWKEVEQPGFPIEKAVNAVEAVLAPHRRLNRSGPNHS